MSATYPLFETLFRGSPDPSFVPLTGKELRDSGIEEAIKAAPESWKDKFKSAIENKSAGEIFTIEEVVESLGGRPFDTRPAAIGALTFHLAKRGVMERTGATVKAHRAARRNGDLAVWRRV